MGIGEKERQLREMKDAVFDSCSSCRNFNNAEKTRKILNRIKDFYDDYRRAGIFPETKKSWEKRYDELINLCIECTKKIHNREYCNTSENAIKLRANI